VIFFFGEGARTGVSYDSPYPSMQNPEFRQVFQLYFRFTAPWKMLCLAGIHGYPRFPEKLA
jgi:hypothetical protein